VDVRVVAATHRDLLRLVGDGAFREDLYYRLQVIPLRVPPLRERPEDIVAIARVFLARLTEPGRVPPRLAPDAVARLVGHPWPGNVRELRNVIDRVMAFAPRPEIIRAEHLRLGP
jgi:transcriptional regulator with PAS, ATPase and Fis domain